MGTCNFCSLRDINRRARKKKLRVTLRPYVSPYGTNEIDCLVHPRDIDPTLLPSSDRTYWRCTFAGLSSSCVCHT